MSLDQFDTSRHELRRAIERAEALLEADGSRSDLTDEYLTFHKLRLARERAACAAFRAGLSIDAIATELSVEPIAVYRVLQRYASKEGLGSP